MIESLDYESQRPGRGSEDPDDAPRRLAIACGLVFALLLVVIAACFVWFSLGIFSGSGRG